MDFCIYVSRARVIARSVGEASIYLDARATNPGLGITGYLHREDDTYTQYLEGPAQALDHLLRIIRRDGRHSDMRLLIREGCVARRFGGWDMAFTDAERRSFRRFQILQGRRPGLLRAAPTEILQFMENAAAEGHADTDVTMARSA